MQATNFLITGNFRPPFYLFLLLISYGTRGQDNQDIFQEKKMLLDTAVRYGRLDNGFTYYIRRHNNPKKTVEFQLVVKGGLFHESDEQVEYAHLIEHVGTVRTKNFPNLIKNIREMGGYNHAGTRNTHTFYWARLPSGEKEIQTGLKVLRDWAQNLDFPQEVIDVERGAVLGELRNMDPYGTWLNKIVENQVLRTTGKTGYDSEKLKSKIEHFNQKAFLDFYKDWYRPDLQAAIIVGDIDIDSMELKVRQLFSDLTMPKRPKNGEELVDAQRIKLSGDNTFQTIIDTINSKFRMEIISKHLNKKSFGLKNRSDFKKWIMQELYKEMVESRSRLFKDNFDPPFTEFRFSFNEGGFGKDKVINGVRMMIDLETEDKEEIKKKFIEALVAWQQIHMNLSISELQKAKERVQKEFIDKEVTSHDLSEMYRHHFVRGDAALAPGVKESLIMDILEEIKLHEMQNVILKYGDLEKNTDFLVFQGKKFDIPDFKVFKRWLAEVKTKDIKPLEPLEPLDSLLGDIEFPTAVIDPIISKSDNLLGVTTVTLQNGIKILFKPSDPAFQHHKEFVTIDAFRPNEIPISDRKKFLAAKMVPEYMEFSGAGPLTKFEIDRVMREKEMRLKFIDDGEYQRIYARCKEKDINELLNLLYIYIDKPIKDLKGYAAWKSSKIEEFNGTAIRGSSNFLKNNIKAQWYPEVPRLEREDLDQISMEDVFLAYNEWYSTLTGFTFIVTGDFDKDILIPKMTKYLSVFPVRSSLPGNRNSVSEFPLKKMKNITRLKNIEQAFVRLYFPVVATRDVKTQIELEVLTKALYERVWNQLRKHTYSPTTGGEWVDVKKGFFAFTMAFDSKLGNEENMIKAAIEELRKLRNNGVDQAWLDAAISSKASTFARDLHNFGVYNFWRDYLKEKLEGNENLEQEVLQYSTMLEHFTTLEDINNAAKNYLSEENLQHFIFIPEDYYEEIKSTF